MGKRKGSFGGSGASSSMKGERKKKKVGEEEATSRKGKFLKITQKEKELLKSKEASDKYEKELGFREIELGRAMDFQWLAKENSIDIDVWLGINGWSEFVAVKETVYPRLVRVLYANLNPTTMTSWIGDVAVKLNVDTWCEVFNLPNLSPQEEAPVRQLSREQIFSDLTGKEGLGKRAWMNVNELPKEATIRLAANILMNIIIPKKGSKEQIKEEEGRVLYAMKHQADLNIAREVVDRVRQTLQRKSTPLCYAMHLMRIMRRAGVDVKRAGDMETRELKHTSHINEKTLGRLGFRKDITHWVYMGRGHVKEQFMDESQPQAPMAAEGEEEGSERPETDRGEEESTIPQPEPTQQPSHTPRPRAPSTSTHAQPTHFSAQLANLQTTLSNQMSHLTSHLTEKLDYHMAMVHSRLESMDSKIDDLTIRVKFCENSLSTAPPRTHTPTPTATPPQPGPTPSTPQDPGSSPLFSMEELYGTPSPSPIPDPPPPHSQPQPTPSPQPTPPPMSESDLATKVVKETLHLVPTPRRFKSAVSKARPKDFSRSFQRRS